VKGALVVAGAALVLAACGAGDAGRSTTSETNTEIVYLLPDEDGVTSTNPGSDQERSGFAVALGRPDGDAYVDLITITAEEADRDREVAESEAAAIELVDVNGHEARLSREGPLGASVDWFQDGRSIGVLGADADALVEVARALDVSDGALAEVPEGYDIIDSFTSVDVGPTASWDIQLGGDGNLGVYGQLVPEEMGLVFFAGFGDRLDRIEVRGHDGYVSTSTPTMEGLPPGFTTTVLTWLERPGFVVTMNGSVPLERMLEVAESLREVSAEEFLSSS
jgi:hypothetical protein